MLKNIWVVLVWGYYKASVSICVKVVFFVNKSSFLWNKGLKVQLLDFMVINMFNFLRNCQAVFKRDGATCIPISSVWVIQFCNLASIWWWCFVIAILVGVWGYLIAVNDISLKADVGLVLFAICYVYNLLVVWWFICLFRSFTFFLIAFFVFLLFIEYILCRYFFPFSFICLLSWYIIMI